MLECCVCLEQHFDVGDTDVWLYLDVNAMLFVMLYKMALKKNQQ